MKKTFLTLIFMLGSFKIFAGPVTTPAGIPKNLHIYDIVGSTFVDLIAHDCSSARYYLDPNHPKYDAIFSLLLAAQSSKREILIRFEGCTDQKQGKIVGVYMF